MWYYATGSERVGPLDEAAFRAAVAAGVVTDQTLVWREGMADWQPWGSIPGHMSAAAAPQMAAAPTPQVAGASPAGQGVCVECGEVYPLSDMVTYQGRNICPVCKPVFFQRLQERGGLPGQLRYAGFWIRWVAKFVDGVITSMANAAVGMLLGFSMLGPQDPNDIASAAVALSWILSIGITAAYTIFFHGRFGATPGKMAVGVKVVQADGSPITYGRATGRFFAEWLSSLIFGIGYIMAAFDDQKRTLHDRICDTRVVKN
jgi:uncharacterized RDD family membrane protein YckC